MKLPKFLAGAVLVLALCLFPAVPVFAQQAPPIPLLFTGNVTIDDVDAPVKTTISAEIQDIKVASVATSVVGHYAIDVPYDGNLGKMVVFKVNGVIGGQHKYVDPWTTPNVTLDLSIGAVPPPLPVAAFSAAPLSGVKPLTVQFTDESLNMADSPSWYWEFGDVMCPYCEAGPFDTLADANEHISAEHLGEPLLIHIDWGPPYDPDDPNAQNPLHEYLQAGTYTVTLTVTNAYGSDTEVKADYIVVTEAGVPTITGISPASGPTAGGTRVTITGTNFVSGATVKIGGASATAVVFVGATSVTATNPAGTAGAKDVVVTTTGGAVTLSGGFTYVAPVPSDGDGAPSTPNIAANLFGTQASFRISSSGKILETIEATSADGNLTITIPQDTIALDKDGKRLESLGTAVDESPPDPPADALIIGLAYDFGPDGATFNPAITLEYTYDPKALPEGMAEEDLVIAYYDAAAGKWVELDCVVDTASNIITASISHFTTFAIIGTVTPITPPAPAAFSVSSLKISPSEVYVGETVTIAVLVANTDGEAGSYQVTLVINDLVEATKEVTVRAGLSKEVTFSVTKEEAGSYTVEVDGLSGSFTVVSVVVSPAPAAFSLSNLSIKPLQVQPKKAVTIRVSVANTGGTEGSYTVVLKIDGVKKAEKIVTIAAGGSKTITFSVTREEAASYTVDVDGLSGSFTVVAPAKTNWPLIGGIIVAVVIVALAIFFLVVRRRLRLAQP